MYQASRLCTSFFTANKTKNTRRIRVVTFKRNFQRLLLKRSLLLKPRIPSLKKKNKPQDLHHSSSIRPISLAKTASTKWAQNSLKLFSKRTLTNSDKPLRVNKSPTSSLLTRLTWKKPIRMTTSLRQNCLKKKTLWGEV